jgi:hypothetical protein
VEVAVEVLLPEEVAVEVPLVDAEEERVELDTPPVDVAVEVPLVEAVEVSVETEPVVEVDDLVVEDLVVDLLVFEVLVVVVEALEDTTVDALDAVETVDTDVVTEALASTSARRELDERTLRLEYENWIPSQYRASSHSRRDDVR